MNKITLSIIALATIIVFTSGIIRHDIDKQEYLNLANEEQFDCVGKINRDSIHGGSCVLIGERFVLTAAHVLIESDYREDTFQVEEGTMIVYQPINHRVMEASRIDVVINGQQRKAKRITLHPKYLDSLHFGSCDIALIELQDAFTNVVPAAVGTQFDELNCDVVGVGYGASGLANKPEDIQQSGEKVAGENVVDSLGGFVHQGQQTLLLCDFDHPTDKGCNQMGSDIPKALEYISSGGDSGGALFRKRDEKWELIGIASGGGVNMQQLAKTGYYGQIMEWTRTSVFSSWIQAGIEE